jgi:hypothetical protein
MALPKMREVLFRKVVVQQRLPRPEVRSLRTANMRRKRQWVKTWAIMSRSTRQGKSEVQLRTLEQNFSTDLINALRACAAGKWVMFGQNDAALKSENRALRDRLKSKVAESLIAQGEEIVRLRRELGYTDGFSLFERYLEYRQMRSANTPGEPKLAEQFLRELEAL